MSKTKRRNSGRDGDGFRKIKNAPYKRSKGNNGNFQKKVKDYINNPPNYWDESGVDFGEDNEDLYDEY